MFTALSYSDGKLRRVTNLEEISDLIADPRSLVWLDLANPNEHDLEMLAREFGFHKLAIEDVQRGNQRPKLEKYEDYYFIVMYSVTYKRPRTYARTGLHLTEVGIFSGHNYVVTVHRRDVKELDEAIRRWEENPGMVLGGNIGFLLYTIFDTIVDNYFPVVDAIGNVIDALEERVFVTFSREAVGDVFALRKDLLALRKIVGPERDVMNVFTRWDLPVLGSEANVVYYTDVYDHLIRIADTIDTYRDLLSGALEGYLSVTSNNLNEIMKVLTAGSIILMSMSVISGIYGMNFRSIPELDWAFGYLWALGLMGTIALVLFVIFRGRGWL